MWKKEIIFGIIAVCLLTVAFVGYRQIKERSLSETMDLYAVVSPQAVLVIETKNAMNFTKALLYNNDFCKIANEENFLPEFTTLIESIDALLTKDAGLASTTKRQSLVAYTIDSGLWKELIATGTTEKDAKRAIEIIRENFYPNGKTEKIKHHGVQITALRDSVDSRTFACAYVKGMFLCSAHLSEIERAIDVFSSENGNINSNHAFVSIRSTAGKNVLANIFINTQAIFPLVSEKINDNFSSLRSKLNSFSDWIGLDLSVSDEQLLVNGYSNKNAAYFTNVFEGQEAVGNDFYNYIPLNTAFFTYYGISNYTAFREKTKKIQGTTAPIKSESFVKEHFAGNVISGYVSLNDQLKSSNYVMFSIKDSTLAAEQLDLTAKKTTHNSSYSLQQIAVYELPAQFQLTVPFGDFVALKGQEYTAITSGYMVVATSPDLLAELVGLISSGYTLGKDHAFLSAEKSYDGNATVLAYIHFPSVLKYANEIFEKSFAEKILRHKDKLARVQTLGWQMENERGQIYHNAFIKSKNVGDASSDSTIIIPKKKTNRQIWSVDFPSKPIFGPVMVRNYVTGTDEILVQDANHKLYFFAHDGNLMFSVQLDALIMGDKMYQVDYYRNKKYQFIFNTAKKLYLLDRKGRFVEKYPIALPVEASAPLAVFDYDNNKDYRIFIPTKDKKIHLYRKDGTSPSDWAFGQTAGVVLNPIQYMRVDGSDYLIANDGNAPYFLNRKGKERITLKSAFDISRNDIYYLPKIKDEKSAFVTTDKQGYVKKINTDGTVKSIKPDELPSAAHHFMLTQVAKSSVYIFVDGNVVSVYNQDMKLIFLKYFDEIDLTPILHDDYLAVYSETSNNVRIFNLNELDVEEQVFLAGSKPSIGQLKPMPNNYIVAYSNGALVCYEVN